MLVISVPDHGEPSAERLKFIHRRRACLKQYLDRKYGKRERPAWFDERGELDGVHTHILLPDYGYIDLPAIRKWMLANKACDYTNDGRLVPWHIRYELLRNPEDGPRYAGAYAKKGEEKDWPKHARIRYCPVPEPKFESPCGPHTVHLHCAHLGRGVKVPVDDGRIIKLPPTALRLDDRVAIAEVARIDCSDCLQLLRSARDAWGTRGRPVFLSSMFTAHDDGHIVMGRLR